MVPSQLFRTADGWVFVMAQLPKFWTLLVERIGRPELADDPRFATPAQRLKHRAELTEVLDAHFSREPTAHWLELLSGHVPVAPVYSLDQALDNPFLARTGMIDSIPHPDRAALRVLANPIRLNGERLANRCAPLLGQHSDAVLAEADFDAAAIADLRRKGIV